MPKSTPLTNRYRRRRISGLLTGGLITLLVLVGGAIGYSQVFRNQDLASQASVADGNSRACTAGTVGTEYEGTQGSNGCQSNEVPVYRCVRDTHRSGNTTTYTYHWQRIRCSYRSGATTCNGTTGRAQGCPCADDSQCSTHNCAVTSSSGPKTCAPFDPGPLTRPGQPGPGGQPAPAQPTPTSVSQPNPGTPGQPTNPTQPVVPTCTVVLSKKDDKGKMQPVPTAQLKKDDVVYLSCPTTGQPTTTFWGFYRINAAGTGYDFVAGGDTVGNPPSTVIPIVLKTGDHFECAPMTLVNNISSYHAKCTADIR